jgi:hypothetical protein
VTELDLSLVAGGARSRESRMTRAPAITLLLVASSIVGTVRADQRPRLLDCRSVDSSGQYYVVAKKDNEHRERWEITFEFAERRPGSQPVSWARNRFDLRKFAEVANPDVSVREGDILLGQGRLKRIEWDFVISSTGLGFVALDSYGANVKQLDGRGEVLVVVARDGTVRHRKGVSDLFSAADIAHAGRGTRSGR